MTFDTARIRRRAPGFALVAALLAPLAFGGCRPAGTAARDDARPAEARRDAAQTAPASDPAGRPYTPLYARRLTGDAAGERGTLKGDFQWAAAAATLGEAAARWEAFLKAHRPVGAGGVPVEEYEDSVQANHIGAARYELMRVYYLLGRAEDGDRLLRESDPLGLLN